jgi:hypothetical protein
VRTCPTCGAHVVDDLEWCNQCYSALRADPTPVATAEVESVRSNIGLPDVKIEPEFSRWRGGPTSFGPLGRILLTLGVLVMLIVGYPLLRGLIYSIIGLDIPGVGLVVLYACAALPAGGYMLNRVWKRERIS